MTRALKIVWRYWRILGLFMAAWFGRVVLTLFYFSVLVPFALILKFTQDPLALKDPHSGWLTRRARAETLKDARRQT